MMLLSKLGSIRKNDSQYGDVNYAWAGHVTTPPSESAHARVSNAGEGLICFL